MNADCLELLRELYSFLQRHSHHMINYEGSSNYNLYNSHRVDVML